MFIAKNTLPSISTNSLHSIFHPWPIRHSILKLQERSCNSKAKPKIRTYVRGKFFPSLSYSSVPMVLPTCLRNTLYLTFARSVARARVPNEHALIMAWGRKSRGSFEVHAAVIDATCSYASPFWRKCNRSTVIFREGQTETRRRRRRRKWVILVGFRWTCIKSWIVKSSLHKGNVHPFNCAIV